MKMTKTKNPDMYFNASRELIVSAKRLRINMTPCEKLLWKKRRMEQVMGFRFRRQHPVWIYIPDFYCIELMLIIEVDGGIHKFHGLPEKDANRTAELNRLGIKVIRFTNEEIKNDVDKVVERIKLEILKMISANSPSPSRGGGQGVGSLE
jgi:very-short-patch-repair endonuclease